MPARIAPNIPRELAQARIWERYPKNIIREPVKQKMRKAREMYSTIRASFQVGSAFESFGCSRTDGVDLGESPCLSLRGKNKRKRYKLKSIEVSIYHF